MGAGLLGLLTGRSARVFRHFQVNAATFRDWFRFSRSFRRLLGLDEISAGRPFPNGGPRRKARLRFPFYAPFPSGLIADSVAADYLSFEVIPRSQLFGRKPFFRRRFLQRPRFPFPHIERVACLPSFPRGPQTQISLQVFPGCTRRTSLPNASRCNRTSAAVLRTCRPFFLPVVYPCAKCNRKYLTLRSPKRPGSSSRGKSANLRGSSRDVRGIKEIGTGPESLHSVFVARYFKRLL